MNKTTLQTSRRLSIITLAAAAIGGVLLCAPGKGMAAAFQESAAISINSNSSSVCTPATCTDLGRATFAASMTFEVPENVTTSMARGTSITLYLADTEFRVGPGEDQQFTNGATKATVRKRLNLSGTVVRGEANITAKLGWEAGRFSISVQGPALNSEAGGGSMWDSQKSTGTSLQVAVLIESGAVVYEKALDVPVQYSTSFYTHFASDGNVEFRESEQLKGKMRNED
jgi:hypothetical protein